MMEGADKELIHHYEPINTNNERTTYDESLYTELLRSVIQIEGNPPPERIGEYILGNPRLKTAGQLRIHTGDPLKPVRIRNIDDSAFQNGEAEPLPPVERNGTRYTVTALKKLGQNSYGLRVVPAGQPETQQQFTIVSKLDVLSGVVLPAGATTALENGIYRVRDTAGKILLEYNTAHLTPGIQETRGVTIGGVSYALNFEVRPTMSDPSQMILTVSYREGVVESTDQPVSYQIDTTPLTVSSQFGPVQRTLSESGGNIYATIKYGTGSAARSVYTRLSTLNDLRVQDSAQMPEKGGTVQIDVTGTIFRFGYTLVSEGGVISLREARELTQEETGIESLRAPVVTITDVGVQTLLIENKIYIFENGNLLQEVVVADYPDLLINGSVTLPIVLTFANGKKGSVRIHRIGSEAQVEITEIEGLVGLSSAITFENSEQVLGEENRSPVLDRNATTNQQVIRIVSGETILTRELLLPQGEPAVGGVYTREGVSFGDVRGTVTIKNNDGIGEITIEFAEQSRDVVNEPIVGPSGIIESRKLTGIDWEDLTGTSLTATRTTDDEEVTFTFTADLSTLKGLGGKLTSQPVTVGEKIYELTLLNRNDVIYGYMKLVDTVPPTLTAPTEPEAVERKTTGGVYRFPGERSERDYPRFGENGSILQGYKPGVKYVGQPPLEGRQAEKFKQVFLDHDEYMGVTNTKETPQVFALRTRKSTMETPYDKRIGIEAPVNEVRARIDLGTYNHEQKKYTPNPAMINKGGYYEYTVTDKNGEQRTLRIYTDLEKRSSSSATTPVLRVEVEEVGVSFGGSESTVIAEAQERLRGVFDGVSISFDFGDLKNIFNRDVEVKDENGAEVKVEAYDQTLYALDPKEDVDEVGKYYIDLGIDGKYFNIYQHRSTVIGEKFDLAPLLSLPVEEITLGKILVVIGKDKQGREAVWRVKPEMENGKVIFLVSPPDDIPEEDEEREYVGLGFRYPIESTVSGYNYVTSDQGYRLHPVDGDPDFHLGIDVAVPKGSRLSAPFSGEIVESDPTGRKGSGRAGKYVVIEHRPPGFGGKRVWTVFMHLDKVTKQSGRIRRGEQFGTVGGTGRGTGVHAHMETWVENTPVTGSFRQWRYDNAIIMDNNPKNPAKAPGYVNLVDPKSFYPITFEGKISSGAGSEAKEKFIGDRRKFFRTQGKEYGFVDMFPNELVASEAKKEDDSREDEVMKLFLKENGDTYKNVMNLARKFKIPPSYIVASYAIESGRPRRAGDLDIAIKNQNYFHIYDGANPKKYSGIEESFADFAEFHVAKGTAYRFSGLFRAGRVKFNGNAWIDYIDRPIYDPQTGQPKKDKNGNELVRYRNHKGTCGKQRKEFIAAHPELLEMDKKIAAELGLTYE